MRELKFRACVEIDRKPLLFYSSGIGLLAFFRMFEYHKNIEQYTGFKDENGKEIYEGDIVSMNLEDEELEQGDCKLISFRDGCFRVGNGYEDEAGCYLRDWRIVGNIHENPELLKLLGSQKIFKKTIYISHHK